MFFYGIALAAGIGFGIVIGVADELSRKPREDERWWGPGRFSEIALAAISTVLAIFSWDVSVTFGAAMLAAMCWTLFIYHTIPFVFWWVHDRAEPLDKSPEPLVLQGKVLNWRSAEDRQRAQLELAQSITSES